MSFIVERKLPPVLVTRDLIEMIERIIKDFVINGAGDDEKQKNELIEKISTSIRDDQGEEVVGSISEMQGKKFHDSTKKVSVNFSGMWGNPLQRTEINVSFFIRPSISEVTVRCGGKNARAVAIGVAESIVRAAESSPNGNGLFHASTFKVSLAFSFVILVFLASYLLKYTGDVLYYAALAMLMLMQIGYYAASHFVFTYCTFDSNAYAKRNQWREWLIKAALGFLLFGTILALAKDYALRFFGLK